MILHGILMMSMKISLGLSNISGFSYNVSLCWNVFDNFSDLCVLAVLFGDQDLHEI